MRRQLSIIYIVLLALLVSENINAQTKRTIHVAKAGTLSNYISSSEKYQIEELTLTGEINGTDFGYLREMAGQTSRRSKYQSETEGKLKVLDISGVKIVSGGSSYIVEDRYNFYDLFKLEFQLVEDDEIPAYVFDDCTNLTTIKISDNVKSIGHYAFSNTTWYNNQPDGLVYIGKVLYGYKGEMPENTKVTIKDGTLGIGGSAFVGCKGLVSISIPNSVVRIGVKWSEAFLIVSGVGAFAGCTGMSAIVLPQNLSIIGCDSFYGCNLNYMSIQSTVNPLLDSSLNACTLGALIWNPAEAILPDNLPNIPTNPNFILYVKDSSYATYKVRNVVVNGAANYIYLSDDGGNFYCPQAFTAKGISYSHNYSMTTGGSGKGWESIVLPFDVQKISHETKGELIPFAAYNQGQDKKPFWLYRWGGSGFVKASSIAANTPYIIAMPNQSTYNSDYILTGNVTFSAENVSIPVTPSFGGTFMPAYGTIKQSASVYALNVVNKYENVTGGYDAGSHFISNLRDVRPFEAYISQGSSTRSTININTSSNHKNHIVNEKR